ncbi:MAG: C4-type zinc ribbon domain-containing protein [Thermoanaerobaculia bacterium]
MKLLETIVELHEACSELSTAEAQIAGVPDWMRELHDEHQERAAEIAEIEAAADEAAHRHREAEAGAADAKEKVKHYQEQIGRVRNQREYSALLQEIDTAKGHVREFEQQAAEADSALEERRKALDEAREAFQDLDTRYSTELAKWEEQKPEVAERAETLRGKVETLRERVPRPILSQLDLLLGRYDGQALAEVREMERSGKGPQMWHCSACHYMVRPQAVVEIRNHGSVVQCDSCKRILYLPGELA